MKKATEMVTATLISSICLVALLFNLGGPDNTASLLMGSLVAITAISALAGVIRLLIPRRGMAISIVVGAITAITGYLACLYLATSGI